MGVHSYDAVASGAGACPVLPRLLKSRLTHVDLVQEGCEEVDVQILRQRLTRAYGGPSIQACWSQPSRSPWSRTGACGRVDRNSLLLSFVKQTGVTVATWRSLSRGSYGGPVLAVWPTTEKLDEAAGDSRTTALCVVPWVKGELDGWATDEHPALLGPAAVTALMNLGNDLAGSLDRRDAVLVLRTLKDAGYRFPPDPMDSWVVANAWSTRSVERLRELASDFEGGKRSRLSGGYPAATRHSKCGKRAASEHSQTGQTSVRTDINTRFRMSVYRTGISSGKGVTPSTPHRGVASDVAQGRRGVCTMHRVAIIGTGHVGASISASFQPFVDVVEYDKREKGPYPLAALQECDLGVVCVDTPANDDGSCNIDNVIDAVSRLPTRHVLLKSTVPPGTTDALITRTGKAICFSPEYTVENHYGNPYGINDRYAPDFLIIGGEPAVRRQIIEWLLPIHGPHFRFVQCTASEAELVKYAVNAFLATKVTFVNELYELCEAFGIDWHHLRELWLMDHRIGSSHSAVFSDRRGFAGRCLPKDLAALVAASQARGCTPNLLSEVLRSNTRFQQPPEQRPD